MSLRNWGIGFLIAILAYVGLAYGVSTLVGLLTRGVILVVLIAVAVLVPMLVFRWL